MIAGCLEEGCSVEEIEKIQHKLERDEGASGEGFFDSDSALRSSLKKAESFFFFVESHLLPPVWQGLSLFGGVQLTWRSLKIMGV